LKIYFNLWGIDLPTKNYLSGSFIIQVRTDDIYNHSGFPYSKARSPLGSGAGGCVRAHPTMSYLQFTF